MPTILVAADGEWVLAQVRGSLLAVGTELLEVQRGSDVLPTVQEEKPDLVILDLQIGNMGAPAICRDLRHVEESGRLRRVPVVMLLDRTADVFQARRADADAWLVKPVPHGALARTVDVLLAGEPWTPEAVGISIPQDSDYLPAHPTAEPEATA